METSSTPEQAFADIAAANVDERLMHQGGLASFLGKLGTAAVCMIAPADLLLSDSIAGKLYQSAQGWVGGSSEFISHAVPDITTGSLILVQSGVLAWVIARNKRLQGASKSFDGYIDMKQKGMSKPRKMLSKALWFPLGVLEKIGEATENTGKRIKEAGDNLVIDYKLRTAGLGRAALYSDKKSKAIENAITYSADVIRSVGTTAIDLGAVNAIGTSAKVMGETTKGIPPSNKRIAWLCGLITASWIGSAEAIKAINKIPGAHYLLEPIGYAFEHATDVSQWYVKAGLTVGMGLLAGFGWKVAGFSEQQKASAQKVVAAEA